MTARICDCEKGANGLGLAGRICDCQEEEPPHWVCEDCGIQVFAFGFVPDPLPKFCATCGWVRDVPNLTDDQRKKLREHFDDR